MDEYMQGECRFATTVRTANGDALVIDGYVIELRAPPGYDWANIICAALRQGHQPGQIVAGSISTKAA